MEVTIKNKQLTKNELIKFAKENRSIIRKYKRVSNDNEKRHSFLGRPIPVKDEIDLAIDESGSKILFAIIEKFYRYQPPTYENKLVEIWGDAYIREQICKFIRKNKFQKHILSEMLDPKTYRWKLFIGINNIHIKKNKDFGIFKFHPRNSKTSNNYLNQLETPYIEIEDIEAPCINYAALKGLNITRPYIGLLPNRYNTLSYCKDLDFSGMIIGYNKNLKNYQTHWTALNKTIFLDLYEEKNFKDICKTIEEETKKKRDLSKRILDVCNMYQSAKNVTYPPAKLLLLSTVLESLLLEETFNRSEGYKLASKVTKSKFFKGRLEKFIKLLRLNNADEQKEILKFINKLYQQRCSVTHTCKFHKLDCKQVKFIEDIIMILIQKLCNSTAINHLEALRDIGLVLGNI